MSETATTAELRAHSERVVPLVVAALDPTGLGLPPAVERLVATAAKGGRLTQEVWLSKVLEACGFLTIYGRHHRVSAVAGALARTPFTGNHTIYSPVRDVVHLAYRFALRRGDRAAAAELVDHLVVPDGWWPLPHLLDGKHLRHPLDRDDPRQAARGAASGLSSLTLLRNVAGSPTWPVPRLDAEIDRILAVVPTLPGFVATGELAEDRGLDPRLDGGLVAQLLYAVALRPALDGPEVRHAVSSLLAGRVFSGAVADHATALERTVAARTLPPFVLQTLGPHSAADVLAYLAAVRAELEHHRPWPDPAWTKLGPSHWPSFAGAVPVGRVRRASLLGGRVGRHTLDVLPDGAGTRTVLMARLRTGDRVGLADAGDHHQLLQPDPGDPAELVAAASELMRLEVTP